MTTDLAARVELASGADRALDVEIALQLRCPNWRELKPWERTNGWAKPGDPLGAWRCMFYDSGGNPDAIPAYTSDLNAALGLVPEGWQWGCGLRFKPWAWVGKPDGCDHDPFEHIEAATPALAIVCAALRARASMEPQDG